ncbi:MAG: DUF971 domain-containing protein, partial [Woeseiaceae bacterium]|nr:DUF971 domain-containing protein [Woeseiaceae bacterium]
MTSQLSQTSHISIDADSVCIAWESGARSDLPHLWLRDNCDCSDCRIEQTSEKRFLIADVSADLAPANVELIEDRLFIEWPDGHRSSFSGEFLRSFGADDTVAIKYWSEGFVPKHFSYSEFLEVDSVAELAIGEFLAAGAIVLDNAPQKRGTLEYLAPRLGPIREVLFDRIHDVEVNPRGYNVAHTALPLPPHNDFASYTWPPSVQALHMLENQATGGLSIIVDGWALLNSLRDEHPDLFDVLCKQAVPFREFDENNETFAIEPIIR